MNLTGIKEKLGWQGLIVIMTIAAAAFGLWSFTISKTDDSPYYTQVSGEQISCQDLLDYSESRGVVSIDEENVFFLPQEGWKLVILQAPDAEGDTLEISFEAENYLEQDAAIDIEYISEENPGRVLIRDTLTIKPGRTRYVSQIDKYRTGVSDNGLIGLYTPEQSHIGLSNISVSTLKLERDGISIIRFASYFSRIVAMASLAVLLVLLFRYIRQWTNIMMCMLNAAKLILPISLIVSTSLIVIYRNADLTAPLFYHGGDEMGVFYYAKMINEYGITLTSARTGGVTGAEMYDYPYSDSFSFLTVRIIGLFTDNVYLIVNIFYFICFILAAIISGLCFMRMGLSRPVAMALGVLYGFTPFLQFRYSHMWLMPIFMMPVACVTGLDIIQDRITKYTEEQRKTYYYKMVFLSFLCASTGLYYAFFTCAIIAASFVILIVSEGPRKHLYPIGYLMATIFGVAVNVLPNIIYYQIHGPNSAGELAIRFPADSEYYGLKLVQMLLPRLGHRIPLFSKIANQYRTVFPLVTENYTAALGLIAATGLVISLFLVFKKDGDKSISYLNLSLFLIGTIGGVGTVFGLVVKTPMRCYNRISTAIMFLGLLQVGTLLEWGRKRMTHQAYYIVLTIIMLFGIYDQTVTFPSRNSFSQLEAIGTMVDEMEEILPDHALIYQLPYYNWPTGVTYKNFIGYIESDDLRWSYGAMQGREEADWQSWVSTLDITEMVMALKDAGYSGLYFDAELYAKVYNIPADEYLSQIKNVLGEATLSTADGVVFFWRIG